MLAWETTVDAPGKPPLFVVLAESLVVAVAHVAGDCKVGLKQRAEIEEMLDLLSV